LDYTASINHTKTLKIKHQSKRGRIIRIKILFNYQDFSYNIINKYLIIDYKMTIEVLNRLKLIGIFCHVVESGSMREAAQKLGISPPAVSQFINQLERELNVTLLYRSTRKIGLSEAGEKYYQQGKKMLGAAEQAEDVINESKRSICGILRIALPVGLAAKPVAQALSPLFEKHPELKLSITASDDHIDLIQERIDIIVDCGEPSDSNMIYHHLGSNGKLLCASPKYLQKAGNPVVPEDLMQHAWLGLGVAEAKGVLNKVSLTHRTRESLTFSPTLRFTFNDLNSLINHVQEGFGIALLPLLEVKHLIESGELVALLPDWQLDSHNIFALTQDKKHPYKVKAALSALKTYFSQDSLTV